MAASLTPKTKDKWSLGSLTKTTIVPDELASDIRAEQLLTVGRLTVVIMLANLINTFVVLMSFWNTGASQLLAIWSMVMCVASGVMLVVHILGRRRFERSQAERVEVKQEQIEAYARNACFLGMLWAMLPIITIPFVDSTGQLVVTTIMMGMLFGGALLISRIPEAAFAFIAPITIGCIVGLQMEQDPRNDFLAVLTLVYSSVLWVAVRWSHTQFVDQHISAAAVAEQTQLISLLMRDFEESTSDWLWQTNVEGVVVDIPTNSRVEDDYNRMSVGAPLLDFFVAGEARQVLKTALSRKQPFRDLVIRVDVDAGEEVKWWSITGKPIFADGAFSGFRGVLTDVTQSKKIEDRVAYMAHYDALTGLPNRVTLQEHLVRMTQEPPEGGRHRVLIWLDLDNFKWVNDTLGHPAGDELLRQVATRITQVSQPKDVIARLGGDEFALIVDRASRDETVDYVKALSDKLGRPYEIWGSTAHCGASIGVRDIDTHGVDIQVLLKHADLALYQAKSMGKGTWCFFTQDLDDRARARRAIEIDLHKALEQDELRLHFQPLISAQTREVVAVETLIRWQHPERGLIMPIDFIEHAEDSGLITRLGDWVIRAALDQARRMPDHVRIAVNISPLQIHSSSLVTTILNALATNGIAANRLELEITESVLMTDTQFTLERLKQLKDIGMRIALDDFGTGFSSLSYLRKFPFDKIKIDKSFIQDLEYEEDSRAITRATLTLAKALGMRCTAEGVETESQSEFLTENGCDELQGYLISRPQPLDKLGHLLSLTPLADLPPKSRINQNTSEPASHQVVDFKGIRRAI